MGKNNIIDLLVNIIILVIILISFDNCAKRNAREDKIDSSLIQLKTLGIFYCNPIKKAEYLKVKNCLRQLDTFANDTELVRLSKDNESPIIRLYAFQVLLNRNYQKAESIAFRELTDTISVPISYVSFYERIGEDNISNLRINLLVKYYKEHKISTSKLDRVLLRSLGLKNIDYYKQLYLGIPPSEKYYYLIKRHYIVDKNPYALVLLAKYHKPSDRVWINDALKTFEKIEEACRNIADVSYKPVLPDEDLFPMSLLAVSYWPDESFRKTLEDISKLYLYRADDFSPTLDYLYQALMAYNDEWSYRIIKDSFNYQKRSINELDFYLYIESFKEAYLKRPMEKYRMLYHMFQNKSMNDNQEDDKQWKK